MPRADKYKPGAEKRALMLQITNQDRRIVRLKFDVANLMEIIAERDKRIVELQLELKREETPF